MNVVHTLQFVAAALLMLAGFLNLMRAGRIEDETKRKNSRTSGWLFIFAGALFLILALGLVG